MSVVIDQPMTTVYKFAGKSLLLPTVENALSHPDVDFAFMITTITHGTKERLRSMELIAELIATAAGVQI